MKDQDVFAIDAVDDDILPDGKTSKAGT